MTNDEILKNIPTSNFFEGVDGWRADSAIHFKELKLRAMISGETELRDKFLGSKYVFNNQVLSPIPKEGWREGVLALSGGSIWVHPDYDRLALEFYAEQERIFKELVFDISNWKQSDLIKEACDHLNTQPDYVTMRPDAKAEFTRFGHALRRAIAETSGRFTRQELREFFQQTYDLDLTVEGIGRYTVMIYGFKLIIIFGIPSE